MGSSTGRVASMAGFDAFLDGLAYLLADYGVSVAILRPGFVHTRMTYGREVPPLACRPKHVAAVAARMIGQNGARCVSMTPHFAAKALRFLPGAEVVRMSALR